MAQMRPCLLIALLCFGLLTSPALCEEAKTVDSEEVINPQPPSQITPSSDIVRVMGDALMQELEDTSAPWVTALMFAGVGVVMIWRGARLFKWIVQVGIGLCFFLLSLDYLTAHSQDEVSQFEIYIQAAVVGAICVFAANMGYDGVLVLMGSLLGGLFYLGVHFLFRHWISEWAADSSIFFLFLGALPMACGVYVFTKKKQMIMKPVALLTSFVGSCLVSSALVFCVMLFNGEGHKCPAWVDYLAMLTHTSSAHVCTDVSGYAPLASYGLWVFLFFPSAYKQIQWVAKYDFLCDIFQKKDLDGDGNVSKLEILGAITKEQNVRDHFGMEYLSDDALKKVFVKHAGNTNGTFKLEELLQLYDKIMEDNGKEAGQAREPLLPAV